MNTNRSKSSICIALGYVVVDECFSSHLKRAYSRRQQPDIMSNSLFCAGPIMQLKKRSNRARIANDKCQNRYFVRPIMPIPTGRIALALRTFAVCEKYARRTELVKLVLSSYRVKAFHQSRIRH